MVERHDDVEPATLSRLRLCKVARLKPEKERIQGSHGLPDDDRTWQLQPNLHVVELVSDDLKFSPQSKMVGERNVDSVLFKLEQLEDQRAAKSGTSGATRLSTSIKTSGSGLIDINALVPSDPAEPEEAESAPPMLSPGDSMLLRRPAVMDPPTQQDESPLSRSSEAIDPPAIPASNRVPEPQQQSSKTWLIVSVVALALVAVALVVSLGT